MSSCNHDCANCHSDCADRKMSKEDFLVAPHETTHVKKVIGVVSGKGGVGKSLVTSGLAALSNKRGHSTAILDSDITGPSIPKAFGLHERAQGNSMGILPSITKGGIKAMSVNLLLEDPSAPVVWRGPVIAGAVQQFWKDVLWGDVDFMFIDMPPGTGDVALTVFQSIPLDGIIIVTTPQDLVTMIVEKAVNMAKLMEIPVLGLVENMSYLECPDCGKKMEIFGKSHVEETALAFGIPNTARMPIDPAVASIIDAGDADNLNCTALNSIMDALEQL
ncbi:MAG: Mrp/NBP35 family ATP-binding protein [Clostridia bacterium]|nr:Mrp/NBP35 family ATP-binding protein [Clostridia bacterium]